MQRQRGAVLIISLVILALLVILSVVGQSNVVMGTRQAGNFGDREVAFQVAEIALEQGIEYVDSLTGIVVDEAGAVLDCTHVDNACLPAPGVGGVYDESVDATIPWQNIDPSTVLPDVVIGTPQYFVERVGETIDSGLQTGGRDSTSFSYGAEVTGSVNYVFYRVTARNLNPSADGVDSRALVQLQAVVRRPF